MRQFGQRDLRVAEVTVFPVKGTNSAATRLDECISGRLSAEPLNPFSPETITKRACSAKGDYRELGMRDGLPDSEGVKRSRSDVKERRGRIWFSLNEEISVLQPSALVVPAFPVTVRFDDLLVGGPLEARDRLRVPQEDTE
jgi:hypothetical protein